MLLFLVPRGDKAVRSSVSLILVEHDGIESGSKAELAEAAEHNESETGFEVGLSEAEEAGTAGAFGVVEHDGIESGSEAELAEAAEHNESETGFEVGLSEAEEAGTAGAFGVVEHDGIESGSEAELAEAAEHNESETGFEVGLSEAEEAGTAGAFGVVEHDGIESGSEAELAEAAEHNESETGFEVGLSEAEEAGNAGAFWVEQLDDTETGGVIGAAKHDVETGGAGDLEVSIRLCVWESTWVFLRFGFGRAISSIPCSFLAATTLTSSFNRILLLISSLVLSSDPCLLAICLFMVDFAKSHKLAYGRLCGSFKQRRHVAGFRDFLLPACAASCTFLAAVAAFFEEESFWSQSENNQTRQYQLKQHLNYNWQRLRPPILFTIFFFLKKFQIVKKIL